MGLAERLRIVDRRLKFVVFPIVSFEVSRPYLFGNLKYFLESLKSLAAGRERESKSVSRFFVLCGSNSKHCPASRKHIECRYLLDKRAGEAVDNVRHHRAQSDSLGYARHVIGRSVRCQHRILLAARTGIDLIVVIHHPDAVKLGCLRGPGDFC